MPRILTATEIYDPAKGAAAYEQGRRQAAQQLAGNALAKGDMAGAQSTFFNAGDVNSGLRLQQLQAERERAARQQKIDAMRIQQMQEQNALATKQREAQMMAGQSLAKGDMSGAQNALFSAGNLDTGLQLQQRNQAQQLQTYKALGNVVRNIKTPEQFERAKAAVSRALGYDTSAYTFDDLPALQSQFIQADRELALKEMKAKGTAGGYGLTPVFGTDAEGNPVLLQVGKAGKAVRTQIPEGVTVSGGAMSVPTGTGTLLVDRRTGQPLREVSKDIAGEKAAQERGKAQGQAQVTLNKATSRAQYALETIDELRSHPGLSRSIGPWVSMLPDVTGAAADFTALKAKATAQTFMEAREALKGAGVLTDFEGKRGEDAIAALASAQTKEQFLRELDHLERMIRASYAALQKTGRGQFDNVDLPSSNGSPPPRTAPAPRQPAQPAAARKQPAQPAAAKSSLPAGKTVAQLKLEARAAVAAGADREKVRQRLQQWGIKF